MFQWGLSGDEGHLLSFCEIGVDFDRLYTVSYTHLDVYKRQSGGSWDNNSAVLVNKLGDGDHGTLIVVVVIIVVARSRGGHDGSRCR